MKLEIIKLDNISWKKKQTRTATTPRLYVTGLAPLTRITFVWMFLPLLLLSAFFLFFTTSGETERTTRKKIGRRGLRPTCRTRLVGSTNETSGVQLGRRRSTALIGPCRPWFIASNLEDVPRVGRPSVTLIGPSRQLAHVLHHGCSAGSPIGPRVGSIINHDFVGFYWICLGLIRFDWVWASLTGLWLGSVGFYWVFIGFTEF